MWNSNNCKVDGWQMDGVRCGRRAGVCGAMGCFNTRLAFVAIICSITKEMTRDTRSVIFVMGCCVSD